MPFTSRLRHGAQGARPCLGIVVTIVSAACAPSPEPSPFTVEDFRRNGELREATLAKCNNDPGNLAETPECVNARAAARLEGGSLRDLPPLGLGDSEAPDTPGSGQ